MGNKPSASSQKSLDCNTSLQTVPTAENIKNLEIELDTFNISIHCMDEKKCYKRFLATMKKHSKLALQITSMFVVFIIYSLPVTQNHILGVIVSNVKLLRDQNKNYWPIFALCVITAHWVSILLFCPGLYFNMMLVGYQTQNFDRALLLNYIGFLIPVLLIYPIMKYSCKPLFVNKFEKRNFYEAISEFTREDPYKTTSILWSLFLPDTIKAYAIALQPNISFKHYILPVFPISLFYISVFSYIGTQISNISHPSHVSILDFHACTTAQMTGFHVRTFFLCVTIIAIYFLAKKFNKKHHEVQENAMSITVVAQSEFMSTNSIL